MGNVFCCCCCKDDPEDHEDINTFTYGNFIYPIRTHPTNEAKVCYDYATSQEEDECPTCLEEYTNENPKISTRCFHHYHLSCIYEWKERSQNCPVCGKVLLFDEPA